MTDIRPVGSLLAVRRLAGMARTNRSGFTVSGNRESVVHSSSVQPVGLLYLQDESTAAQRDRLAHRGGEAVLDALSDLRSALLSEPGCDAVRAVGRALDALRHALDSMSAPADPALADLLAEIRVRGRVELARRAKIDRAVSGIS